MGRRRAFASERDEPVRQRLQRLDAGDRAEASPAQAELLRLQRSGGNGAVAGVLARDETKTKAPPPRKYGPEEQKPEKPRTMKIDGVGEIPLVAINTPSKDRNEVTLMIARDSPFMVELQKRYGSGGGLGKVTIDFGDYMTWTLGDVYIGSLEFGGGSGTASITLNYSKLEIATKPDEPPGKVE